MSRSAAGVDYSPFQVFQKLVLSRSRELYYIGGSDVLTGTTGAQKRSIRDQQSSKQTRNRRQDPC